MFADKDLDAVSIATPNHWHALAAIWACRAGTDVYVERPASYDIHEGLSVREVARKTNRMVKFGSQSRSVLHLMRATQLLQEGAIGKVYAAKAFASSGASRSGRRRPNPFLGLAPMRPFTKNSFAYNWHWFGILATAILGIKAFIRWISAVGDWEFRGRNLWCQPAASISSTTTRKRRIRNWLHTITAARRSSSKSVACEAVPRAAHPIRAETRLGIFPAQGRVDVGRWKRLPGLQRRVK
jgi:hypothetical protein